MLRTTYWGVGSPLGWSCSTWNEGKWTEWLARPSKRWVFFVEDQPIGMTMLVTHDDGSAEILAFGLTAQWVGKGFGGSALTQAIRVAWDESRRECG